MGQSANIDNGVGNVAASGSIQVSPSITMSYKLTASATILGSTITTSEVVTIDVVPPLDPNNMPNPEDIAPLIDPTTSNFFKDNQFLIDNQGQPIQVNVQPNALQENLAAIIKGEVTDRTGNPLPGVRVEIKENNKLGYTVTRNDGQFDLMVNGGGSLVLQLSKPNYLTVHRHIDTDRHQFSVAESIVLIPLDSQVTTISATASSMQVARSTMVSDVDGDRQVTMLFPPSTTATLELKNGELQTLSTYQVRATEYTVGDTGPQAMPGTLPPQSGYTYAVELSLDEAINVGSNKVTFNHAIPVYVDNFIGFSAGGVAPVGWYDYASASWVPAEDGRVVDIIAINGGQAALDVTGGGVAATATELAELNINSDELAQLASLYTAGTSLVRFQVNHFTPYDINWPIALPETAVEPPELDGENDGQENPSRDCFGFGSIIECQSQVIGESVPIVGTPYLLNYRSSRAKGYGKNRFTVTLTGNDVPIDLLRVELIVNVAGKKTTQIFTPTPNQTTTYTWDGKDSYGRDVYGPVTANVTMVYHYPASYARPNFSLGPSFGLPSS